MVVVVVAVVWEMAFGGGTMLVVLVMVFVEVIVFDVDVCGVMERVVFVVR